MKPTTLKLLLNVWLIMNVLSLFLLARLLVDDAEEPLYVDQKAQELYFEIEDYYKPEISYWKSHYYACEVSKADETTQVEIIDRVYNKGDELQ